MNRQDFPYCFDFDPKTCKIIPKFEGQWKTLKGGIIRAWFTESQFNDANRMIKAINDGESNIYQEAHNEVVDEYELVL